MKSEKTKGFTLIEIMVAVSIFVIVAFIVSSTLLSLIAASRRADKLRSIIDNVNFAMESMTQGIKFGRGYTFVDGTSADPASSFAFTDKDGSAVAYTITNGSIWFQKDSESAQKITSPEAIITSLEFYDNNTAGDCLKSVLIKVNGQALVKQGSGSIPDDRVDFSLQTAVSQDISSVEGEGCI